MKQVDPLAALKQFVNVHPNQRTAASALGISQAFLSDILAGNRAVPPRIFEIIGIRQIVVKS